MEEINIGEFSIIGGSLLTISFFLFIFLIGVSGSSYGINGAKRLAEK